jgi:hypothetical protein
VDLRSKSIPNHHPSILLSSADPIGAIVESNSALLSPYDAPRRPAQILEEALQLSAAEQAWLIDNLMGERGLMYDEAFAAWQKEVGEPEPGYDEWFRAGVEEALADTSPGVPHEEVMRALHEAIQHARGSNRR